MFETTFDIPKRLFLRSKIFAREGFNVDGYDQVVDWCRSKLPTAVEVTLRFSHYGEIGRDKDWSYVRYDLELKGRFATAADAVEAKLKWDGE